MGHLDRVRMAQLMRREPPTDPGRGGRPAQLAACGRRLPVASGGRAVDHAEQWANREPDAEPLPGLKLLPSPAVHPHLATLITFAMAQKHRTAASVQVGLSER